MKILHVIAVLLVFMLSLSFVEGLNDTGAYCATGYVNALTSSALDGFACSNGAKPTLFNFNRHEWPQFIGEIYDSCVLDQDAIVVGFLTTLTNENHTWLDYTKREYLCVRASSLNLNLLDENAHVSSTNNEGYQCPTNTTFVLYFDDFIKCSAVQFKNPITDSYRHDSGMSCPFGFFTSLSTDLMTGKEKAQCLWNMKIVDVDDTNRKAISSVHINSTVHSKTNVTTFACDQVDGGINLLSEPMKTNVHSTPSSLFKKVFTGENQLFCGQLQLKNNSLVLSKSIEMDPNVFNFNCNNGFLASLSQHVITTNASSMISYSYTCLTLELDSTYITRFNSTENDPNSNNYNNSYVIKEEFVNGNQSPSNQEEQQDVLDYFARFQNGYSSYKDITDFADLLFSEASTSTVGSFLSLGVTYFIVILSSISAII